MDLFFGTTNPGKLRELRRLVAGLPIRVVSPDDLAEPVPDVVEDGANGILVGEKDPTGLAAALDRLVRDPETRTRLGAEARRRAASTLTWDAAAKAFEDCYAQAAALDAR